MSAPPASLQQARAAKAEALKRFEPLAQVVGVGITRVGDGYAVKVNLREQPDAKIDLPQTVEGVPVCVEIVGALRKR